jgi:hypothetical protein
LYVVGLGMIGTSLYLIGRQKVRSPRQRTVVTSLVIVGMIILGLVVGASAIGHNLGCGGFGGY